jgi:hypothetical protein
MAVSTIQEDKKKALNLAIAQIEKNCGKGLQENLRDDPRRSVQSLFRTRTHRFSGQTPRPPPLRFRHDVAKFT